MSSLYGGQGYSPTGTNQNTSTGNYGKPFKEKTPSGYKSFTQQNFTPEQMKLFGETFGHVGPESYTSKLAQGNEGIFNQIEAPALKQFNQLQGNTASRFSGMGMGARNSSGFQNYSNQATSDFAQQLQSNRQGLQRQALQDLMSMSSDLLGQRPFERGLVKKPQSTPWAETIGNFGGMIPGMISSFSGGGKPQDAVKGASNIFGSISNLFGG